MTTENRTLPGAGVTDVDTRRHEVEARIVSYQTADRHGSVWAPGVFSRSLANEPLPVACIHHNLSRPIGRVTAYRDTPTGLDVTIKLADTASVPDAAMAWSMLQDGVLREFSTTFERRPGGTRMLPSHQRGAYGANPAREVITDAGLVEVSAVTAASVPGTAVLALRGRQYGAVLDLDDDAERALARALARARGLTGAELELLRERSSLPRRPRLHLASARERQLEARSRARLDITLERSASRRRLERARFEHEADRFLLDVLKTGHNPYASKG